MSSRLIFLFLLLTMLGGCNSESVSSNLQSSSPKKSFSETKTQPKEEVNPANLIQTKPLNPQPIVITLENLPPPFTTNSASKPPQVIPIPHNPSLQIPKGFQMDPCNN